MLRRFDYIRYDDQANYKQKIFKGKFVELEDLIEEMLLPDRYRALVLTSLEEAYCWIGKAIRDEQINLRSETELQEERGNS